MITLEEAYTQLKSHISSEQRTRRVPLLESLGCVLAEDLKARVSQPPFPRSPLDGYAVRSEDVQEATGEYPIMLTVIEEVMAGEFSCKTVGKGQAVRIMTGAPIPDGADTVIRQEDTDYGETVVHIFSPSKSYGNYCPCGEDFRQGDCLLIEGDTMDATCVAIAASMGYESVKVNEAPRVALFTTGNELVEPGMQPSPGQIYNSNQFYLSARLKELGIPPLAAKNLKDSPQEAADEIKKIAAQADLIITTGGVSVGKKDIMHEVLDILGAKKLFWRVCMKPGSPVMAAMLQDTCILGLSGNPFGVVAGVEVLVRPVLSFLTGNACYLPIRQQAVLSNDINKKSSVTRYMRAFVKEGYVSVAEGSHRSGVLSSMKNCNCFIEVPGGCDTLRKGEAVWVIYM